MKRVCEEKAKGQRRCWEQCHGRRHARTPPAPPPRPRHCIEPHRHLHPYLAAPPHPLSSSRLSTTFSARAPRSSRAAIVASASSI